MGLLYLFLILGTVIAGSIGLSGGDIGFTSPSPTITTTPATQYVPVDVAGGQAQSTLQLNGITMGTVTPTFLPTATPTPTVGSLPTATTIPTAGPTSTPGPVPTQVTGGHCGLWTCQPILPNGGYGTAVPHGCSPPQGTFCENPLCGPGYLQTQFCGYGAGPN